MVVCALLCGGMVSLKWTASVHFKLKWTDTVGQVEGRLRASCAALAAAGTLLTSASLLALVVLLLVRRWPLLVRRWPLLVWAAAHAVLLAGSAAALARFGLWTFGWILTGTALVSALGVLGILW
ncbi:hypothetical protein FJT64_012592 [Amphibalanus amphitrite]|uniref:Uncharacterized protein n=1 Tax=Amphibalanus amphitrite TaxID=1232801 RepID=A0A6A4VI02_AMPAM|nr:hypothetical protein FJT64_012592 [Amphibalanus amphitrite]